MDWLTDPQIWAALLTLTALEIVLGIDNVIFISLVAERLPAEQRAKARAIGLGAALLMRLALLAAIAWIIGLTAPAITVFDFALSWRDLILLAGGLFLLVKATLEI
ncbi:MAG: TerC family protein, partial [Rhodospirillales bacterium]|nr:TerC family protein [Rhodospirillales bacterium]